MIRTKNLPNVGRGARARSVLSRVGALAGAVAAAVGASMVAVAPAPAAPPAAPGVALIDAAGLKHLVLSRKGQVVIVNFWATWCIPCEEELPGFARLQHTYGGRGVSVVTVSFDDRHDAGTKVAPFLAKTGIKRDAFIDSIGGNDPDQRYLDFLEPSLPKDAALPFPRTYVFARNGREVKSFPGIPVTYAALQKTITPLLK